MQQTARHIHDAAWAAEPSPNSPMKGRELLNWLRLTFLACRVAARPDLEAECAALSLEADTRQKDYAFALMRGLETGLGRRPVLYRPGVDEVSFDEAWLLRAIEMAALERWDSLEFLIRSRIKGEFRRTFSSFLHGISKQYRNN